MKTIILDTECFHNFFLLSFMDVETGKVVNLRRTADQAFDSIRARRIMANNRTVSFNGLSYDLPMICLAIGGMDNAGLKAFNDKLIKSQNSWQVIRNAEIDMPAWDHIDIMHVAPGQAGLKLYGGRIHADTLRDLPYHPDTVLTPDQMDEVEAYCVNDLGLTANLYQALLPQIELRERMGEQYGLDLRSKGDAQIAEAVLKHELEAVRVRIGKPTIKAGTTFKYSAPAWIEYADPVLNQLLIDATDTAFKVQPSGSVAIPADLGRKVHYAGADYTVGIGGLHSNETGVTIKPGPDELLFDVDFASYYPSIILGEGYYPKHLGPKFLDVYRRIFEERIRAKNRVKEIKQEIEQLERKIKELEAENG